MRRLNRLIGLATIPLLALGLAGIGPPVAVARSAPIPKVVVIVGPSGDATDRYRVAGAAAADAARAVTPDVVEVVSPDATWPAARKALQDASIVVYLGHGNGWPSRYRPALYPPTQNGLGLNPVAGGDDVAHQYFGEAYLERDVHLAPNAVVVLSHLCYASGNSEPGLPEGTLDVARQRVDNFAAGWIAAGARAVVAEAYLDPAYYVRALLSGHGSVQSAWDTAPTANGHVLSFASARRSGFVDLLDPESATGSGFNRSLVIRGSVASTAVVGSGLGSAGGGGFAAPPATVGPTLASVGAQVGTPTLRGLPVAGAKRTLTLPMSLPRGASTSLVDGLQLSVRWDPLDVRAPAAADAAEEPGATPPDPAAPDQSVSGDADAPTSDAPTSDAPTSDATAPDPFALVVPEVSGDVIDPLPAKATKAGWRIHTRLPDAPGLYALSVALHDADGVALDAATQSLVPRLVVRVVGADWATIVAPAGVTVTTDETFGLPVAVQNSGSASWAMPQPVSGRPDGTVESAGPVEISARWVPLGDAVGSPAAGSIDVRREVAPGDRIDGRLSLTAPSEPGSWLLVVDVATPELPSLVAAGSPAGFVRVTVTAPAPENDSSGVRPG